jgi:hypothetical protein
MTDIRATLTSVIGALRSISPFHTETSDPEIAQECPHCGFQGTSNAYDYCPRDGTRLKER